MDSGSCRHPNELNNRNQQRVGAYEYLFLARSGSKGNGGGGGGGDQSTHQNKHIIGGRTGSVDHYVQMNSPSHFPQPTPRNIMHYENATLRSYNPNRKLRRNRDAYESFGIE